MNKILNYFTGIVIAMAIFVVAIFLTDVIETALGLSRQYEPIYFTGSLFLVYLTLVYTVDYIGKIGKRTHK